MYLRHLLVLKSTVISTLGLAAMNSLMNPRRMTTTSLSTVWTIIFEYPFGMISLIWHTIRLSASSRTLFTTPESYILVWPDSVITFLVPFVTQYWCFHELELTNFQIMNSLCLVLFILSVRNDWQTSMGTWVSPSNKICWPNDLDFLASLDGVLIESSVYWSVTIAILWALQDSAIFIIISMTNKEKSSNVEPDESKGAWDLIITDMSITIASIIDWLSMYVWSLVIQSRMADVVLWYGVHSLVTKHSGTSIHSPWKTCLANKLLELHASRYLMISFSFVEIRGFSASTSSESLGNFSEFLVIFFLLRSLEQTTNLV